jgi:hypothetical protein
MKKLLIIIFLTSIIVILAGINSCNDHNITINAENTRISKIKLEWLRKFNDYWVIVDIDYLDDKISSIYLNNNSRQSNPGGLLYQYEYNNEKLIRYGGTFSKETYDFNGINLIEWMGEIKIDGQFVPSEKIQYEYKDNNLKSFNLYISETLFPFKYDTLNYEGTKLRNYKSYYAPYGLNLQSELIKECVYTYQDNNLLYIDQIGYLPDMNYNHRYSFVYEGTRISKIIKQYVDDPEKELLNFFEFSYDELGRITTILYKSGIENSYNVASEAKWTFEYEEGKSNLKFDVDKILWKIMDIDATNFPEKIINDFFTIYPN